MQNRKSTYVEKTPNDVYREVASESELTPEEVAAIGGIESQHGKYNKPLKGGSATGLFQFQPKTAEYLSPGSAESLEDLNTQAELMKLYLEKNKVTSAEDAYAKHNLGKARGQSFMAADDNTPISEVVPKHVIDANPGLYKVKTVGEAKQRIREKLEKGKKSSGLFPSLAEMFKGE